MQSDNSLPPCVSSDAVDDAVTGRETGSHLENTGRGGRGKLPSHLMFNMPTRISRKKLIGFADFFLSVCRKFCFEFAEKNQFTEFFVIR